MNKLIGNDDIILQSIDSVYKGMLCDLFLLNAHECVFIKFSIVHLTACQCVARWYNSNGLDW